jgi:beta-N-acetylhexosaminidase
MHRKIDFLTIVLITLLIILTGCQTTTTVTAKVPIEKDGPTKSIDSAKVIEESSISVEKDVPDISTERSMIGDSNEEAAVNGGEQEEKDLFLAFPDEEGISSPSEVSFRTNENKSLSGRAAEISEDVRPLPELPPAETSFPSTGSFLKEPDFTAIAARTVPLSTPEKQLLEEINTVDSIIRGMTIEEKIGQIFMLAILTDLDGNAVQTVNSYVLDIMDTYRPGGIVLFTQNIQSIEQTRKLIAGLQKASAIPLLIAVDEEGGDSSRLNSSLRSPETRIPATEIVGKTGDTRFAYEMGRLVGRELYALGINMNLAPVADLRSNPANPVLYRRAFGNDPEAVANMVAATVRGIQDENVSAVIKHFPGHGATKADTHTGSASVEHTMERLRQVEFLPFKRGIESGADGVMTAHIETPNATGNDLPATLSPQIQTEILRQQLGHNKLIITDALDMRAITDRWDSAEAARLAFKAGADILLIPEDPATAIEGITTAVAEGDISLDRLEESIKRILKIKFNRGILDPQPHIIPAEDIIGSKDHKDLIDLVYLAAQ